MPGTSANGCTCLYCMPSSLLPTVRPHGCPPLPLGFHSALCFSSHSLGPLCRGLVRAYGLGGSVLMPLATRCLGSFGLPASDRRYMAVASKHLTCLCTQACNLMAASRAYAPSQTTAISHPSHPNPCPTIQHTIRQSTRQRTLGGSAPQRNKGVN